MASSGVFAYNSSSSSSNNSTTTTGSISNTTITESLRKPSTENYIDSASPISDKELESMFGDVYTDHDDDNTTAYQLENVSLGGSLEGADQNCKICQNKFNSPRVLSCLHVFCEFCLEKLRIDEKGDSLKLDWTLECPTCKHPTKVGKKGIEALHFDYVLTNILDLSSIEPSMLACTSCKSKETAISRCNDCANFLCASCDNAHQYMRCFEAHEVMKLDDLRESPEKVAIHKPLHCSVHTSENLKYYCFSCQTPVCNDCLIADHKGAEHQYETISEAEKPMRAEIDRYMKDAKAKIAYCDQATNNLNSSLSELQNQTDTARDLINESYQSFKAVLDKCRENAIKELDTLHDARELKIMELLHGVEKSVDEIDGACKFTEKVLNQANGPELLSLKKMICNQFAYLIQSTPKVDVNFSLEFHTNFEKFELMAQDKFGRFRTEASSPSPKESTPPPTLPGMPILINNKTQHQNGNCSNSQGTMTGSVTASSPISLPQSMQSSFDGDISTIGNGFMLPPNVLTPDPPSPLLPSGSQHQQPQQQHQPQLQHSHNSTQQNIGNNTMPGMASIVEYNLHRLANLADNSNDIVPDAIVPPIVTTGNITIADLISGDTAMNNLQALAKLGGLNHNDLMNHNNAMDTVPLMNDYPTLSNSTSPIMPNSNDDLAMHAFQSGPMGNGIGSMGGMGGGGGNSVAGRSKAASMQIRYKFGSLGPSKGYFNSPHGFCLGVEEEIIVADTNNHRVQVFDKNGQWKFQFGVPGKDEGQLWYPRKVAVMRTINSKFVVCDRGNERSRMQIFTKNGHFIKKIAIRYIDIVAGLAVTNKGHIVAVDSVSPTVFIISEDGELVHWFDCSDYMREPSDIAINGTDFYVCDFKGHCVAVFSEDGRFKTRIGSEKVTCFPNGIDISDAGDVLIGDSHGNRFHVACYTREGVLISEYECPYVKVSRCCGLKITSEGFVVTLAKNNHHVLVLNTLYVQ